MEGGDLLAEVARLEQAQALGSSLGRGTPVSIELEAAAAAVAAHGVHASARRQAEAAVGPRASRAHQRRHCCLGSSPSRVAACSRGCPQKFVGARGSSTSPPIGAAGDSSRSCRRARLRVAFAGARRWREPRVCDMGRSEAFTAIPTFGSRAVGREGEMSCGADIHPPRRGA